MRSWLNYTSASVFALLTTVSFATPPKNILTHNLTNAESNAYIAGKIASRHPTPAHQDHAVPWFEVKMACVGHTTNNKCWAIIKMETNTDHAVELGRVEIDLTTGAITPAVLTHNGYTFIYNGIINGDTVVTLTNAPKFD